MKSKFWYRYVYIVLPIFIMGLLSAHPYTVIAASEKPVMKLLDQRKDKKDMSMEMIEVNGTPYMPLKELCLFSRVGFKYDPITKGVTLKKGEKSVTIIPNQTEYKVGKKKVELKNPPIIVNWKMVAPPMGMARIFEILLDCPVVWRSSKNSFIINDQEPVTFWEDHPDAQVISTTRKTDKKKKTIQPGDLLLISVWQKGAFELDELTREREVDEDGTIKFPFIGRTSTIELTPSQLESQLARKLASYIKNPEVTVRVKGEKKAFTVQIFGAVRNPGTYTFTSRSTLMEAINKAGGFDENAKLAKVRVTRFIHHSPYQTDLVNCKLILHEGQRQYDVPIEDKDIVFVPKGAGFWNSVGEGIKQVTPILSVTALVFSVIFSARSL